MIIYQGPSELDNKPIVVILTGLDKSSKNSKTGEMPQVWILRADIHPTDALRTGEDSTICGNCTHRPKVLGPTALSHKNRSCYVNMMGVNQIYKKYSKGNYKIGNLEYLSSVLKNRQVRIGAYGDPAAVPIHVWDTLLKYCQSTGYTHQWKTCDAAYSKYCMASCDNPLEVLFATQKGYRTFFVQNVPTFQEVLKQVDNIKLAHCPASKEMGKSTTCSKCMACNGTRFNRESNVTIMLH